MSLSVILNLRFKKKTYRITRLLNEDLCEANHGRVVVQLLRKIDHRVCGILLIAGSCGSEKGAECSHGGWVALLSSAGCVLETK